MTFKAFITSCAGTVLTEEEKSFFADQRPSGFILFARNCENPDQLKKLIDSVRNAVQDEKMLVLVDQEGGRVARMQPPHWTDFPSGRVLGNIYRQEGEAGLSKIRLISQWLATEIYAVGINVNCVPVLDVPVPGAHDVIGTRAYGETVEDVITVAKAVVEGHRDAGVLPVIKHIPGHGRAGVDSHLTLPVIKDPVDELRNKDFLPFKAFNNMPLGMTGHLLLPELDEKNPVSTSRHIIDTIIRKEIGFDGLLMSDDLDMEALDGTIGERAKNCLEAGCDLPLYCKGEFHKMTEVAEVSPELSGDALRRINTAKGQLSAPKAFDKEQISAWMKENLAKYQ